MRRRAREDPWFPFLIALVARGRTVPDQVKAAR
jgi:hypothetical protein